MPETAALAATVEDAKAAIANATTTGGRRPETGDRM
jgi:hypothetical protein